MKKRILVLVVGFLFIGIDGFAADEDLIVNGNATVNGNVGIGTTTPGAKLDVQGGSVKLGGIFITHVIGTNPTCPSGTYLMRKWNAKTCDDSSNLNGCKIPAGWNPSVPACSYIAWSIDYYAVICTANTWTEAVCMGN
jgi:hypothetical protein